MKWHTAVLFHFMYWIYQSAGVVVSHVTTACNSPLGQELMFSTFKASGIFFVPAQHSHGVRFF